MEDQFKLIIITLTFILCFQTNSMGQNKYSISTGVGISLLGSGDDLAINFENEFKFSLNQFISSGLSLNYGRAFTSRYLFSSSFVQGNLNIIGELFSKSKFGINLGVGVSVFDLNEVSVRSAHTDIVTGEWIVDEFNFHDYTTIGLNLLVEPRYNISERLFLGIKLMAQLYKNGDTNAGGILKLGYRFN